MKMIPYGQFTPSARAATSKQRAPGNRKAACEGSPATQPCATTSTLNFASSAALNSTLAQDFFCFRHIFSFLRFCFSTGCFCSPVNKFTAAKKSSARPRPVSGNLKQRHSTEKMTDIEIQKVTLNDIDQLQKIGRQTFYETFSAGNSEENMTKYLDVGFSLEKLTTELSDNNAEFYFATLDNNVIGYLKLNFGQSQTELQDDKALEIERIYVLKDFHGKSVGQILYDKAIHIARQKNADYVWLGVWEENPRAINFYKKNGFVEFDKHVFKLGNDEQTDIMMKLKLNK